MKRIHKTLLAAALLVPSFAFAQIGSPAGLIDYMTHNYDRLGTPVDDGNGGFIGTDSGDNTTVWTDVLANNVSDLEAAGYFTINGSQQGTRPQSTANPPMLRLSNRDDNNVAVDGPVGVGVAFPGDQSKGFVSFTFNFINATLGDFFIELNSGGSTVASLNITEVVPTTTNSATITINGNTSDLANAGFSNYEDVETTVQFGWEGGLLDFYFSDNGGTATTISGTSMGVASIDEFRVYALNVATQSPAERMRFDNFNVDLAVVPEPSTFAILAGFAALGLVMVRRRK